MNASLTARLLGIAGLCGTSLACSTVDLYPITLDASGAAGQGGDGNTPLACAPAGLTPGDSTRSLVVAGVSRSFILHVPAAVDDNTAAALVLDFHGLGESAAKERASSPYPQTLDAEGAIMAFPEGLSGPAGAGWNVGPCCVANVDDVAFARAVVAEVERLACIDTRRVYAVGVLTGGGMAHYLACHAADVFAAVAPAAFDLLQENQADCVPARPVSVVMFRGTADSRVPYDGGASTLVPGLPLTFLGARASLERWAEIDGCTDTASAPDQNGCSGYSACAGGAEVILCTKQGGREEPGDPAVSWPILQRHPL